MQKWGRDTIAKHIGGQLRFRVEAARSQEDFIKDLEGIIKRSADLTPAFERVGMYLQGSIDRNFEAEGRPKWVPLAESTIKDRVRQGYGPGPILQRTGALRRSLVSRGDSNNIFEAKKRSLVLGSRLNYYQIHNLGGSKIPQRQMSTLQPQDRAQVSRIINRYIREGK